jgi:SPP1 gp7 family putative phage head morphogenesis protein
MATIKKPPGNKTRPKKQATEFGPTQRLQKAYERGIREITGRVLLSSKKKPEQSYADWLAGLARRSQEKDIQDASELLAKRMVFQAQKTNWRTWREAASRSTKAQTLYRLLEAEMQGATGARVQQLIRENAGLISSLPLEAAASLADEVLKAQQSGARPKTVAKMAASRFPQLVRSRVHLISRTETAKASAALTHARCERLAIEWYQWETSQDQRTRASHKNMNGVVVPWSQTPSPEALIGEKSTLGAYNAGECPNCRCLIIPILTLDDIQFPARVYWNGSIQRMTKQAFKQVAVGLEERAAA